MAGLPALDLLAVAELEEEAVMAELLLTAGKPLPSDPDPVPSLGTS
jgi:hypothetical protein